MRMRTSSAFFFVWGRGDYQGVRVFFIQIAMSIAQNVYYFMQYGVIIVYFIGKKRVVYLTEK